MNPGTAWPGTIPARIGKPAAGDSRVSAEFCFGIDSSSTLAGLDVGEYRNEVAQNGPTIPPVDAFNRTGIQNGTIRLDPNMGIRTGRGGTETMRNMWRDWLGRPGGKVVRLGRALVRTRLCRVAALRREGLHAKRNQATTSISRVQILRSRTVERDGPRRSRPNPARNDGRLSPTMAAGARVPSAPVARHFPICAVRLSQPRQHCQRRVPQAGW